MRNSKPLPLVWMTGKTVRRGINEKLKQLTKVLDGENAKLKSYQEQLERTSKAEEENSKRSRSTEKQYQKAAKQFGENSPKNAKITICFKCGLKRTGSKRKGREDLRIKILNQQATVGRTEKNSGNYQNNSKM